MKNLKKILLTLVMFGRILGLLFEEKWQTLIDSVPAIKQARDNFKTMVDNINAKIGRYKLMTRGIAAQKRAARIELNMLGYSIISSARSWCIKNSNFELAAKFEITVSEINTMPYKAYMPFIGECITLIEPLVPQLAAFNVTPQSFALWQEKYQGIQEINPVKIIKDRKALGKVISQDVKTAMEFLDDQITPLMGNFQSAPEFFLGFYTNKKIGLPLVHHTRLVARVVNEVGVPYYAITVTVNQFTDPQTGKTYAADSSITDSNGNCEVSEFFPGFRTVTISGQGIQNTTFPATEFRSGKAEIREYVVAPSFNNIPSPAPEQKQKANS